MSNLIKYNYIYYDKNDTKIIDSDSRSDVFKPLEFAKAEDLTPSLPDNLEPEPVASGTEESISVMAENILSQAREQAEGILKEARLKGEQIKEEKRAAGKQEGYQQGMEEAAAKIRQMEDELNQQKKDNQKEYERQLQQIEPSFVRIMISYLEKLTGVLAAEKKEIILHLMDTAIQKIERSHSFLIRVGQEDIGTVNSNRELLLSSLGEEAALEIIEDKTLTKNQCIIETDDRIIDCSLDVQLKGLLEDLKLLSFELEA